MSDFTHGRRRDEILTLTWPMIDWQHSMMNLPDTKSGQLKMPVSGRVLALLKHIHEQTGRPRTGHVLRTDKDTRLTGLNGTWYRFRKAAAVVMDLRRHPALGREADRPDDREASVSVG